MAGDLGDPYVVGELIGFAFGAGAVGYLVARVVFPRGRTAQVARLMQSAGVEEDAGTRPQGWRPPPILVGLVAALLGGLWHFAQVASKGFAQRDLPELRKGFVHGCVESCVKGGGPAPLCEQVCNCTLEEVAVQNPDDQHLLQWFSGAARKDAEALRVLSNAQARCVARAKQPQP